MTDWKDSLQRRDEVKAAFEEGYMARPCLDEDGRGIPAAWETSRARKALSEPLGAPIFSVETRTHRPVGKTLGAASKRVLADK